MAQQKVAVNRTLTGILTIVCLVSGFAMLVYMPAREAVAAALIRVGLLLGAFWLALPTKTREAAWANVSPALLIGSLAAAVAIAVRPALIRVLLPILVALLIVGYVLKPRDKRRPTRRE